MGVVRQAVKRSAGSSASCGRSSFSWQAQSIMVFSIDAIAIVGTEAAMAAVEAGI